MKKILLLLSVVTLAFAFCLSASAAEEKVVIDNVVYELVTDKYLDRFDNPYGPHYVVTDFFEDNTLGETTTKITIVDEIAGIKVLGIDTNESQDLDMGGYYVKPVKYPNVKEVILPDAIKYMGEYAFTFFPSVENLILPSELRTITEGTFCDMTGLKSITLPKNITSISWCAFKRCSSLKKVVFQGNITYIGDHAFLGCEKLSSISFPETLKEIGEAAFYGTALKKIVLPADIDTYYSFKECTALKNVVYISDKPVESIKIDAFWGCTNLKNIYIRAIATKGIGFGYNNIALTQIRLQHIYFEGSQTLWNKLTTKKVRDTIASNDIHTGFYYKHEHSYALDGAPTCKKGGTFNCKCDCGDSYKVSLPKDANNHKFGAWKVTKEATCAVTGIKKRTCKTCGYVQQAKIRKEYLGTSRITTKEITDSKIVLEWEKAENATGYTLYETNKKHTKYTKIATLKADQRTYTFENLQSGKIYRYVIEPFNIDKYGNKAVGEKTEINKWTLVNQPPKNLKAVSTEPGIVELTWDASGPDVYYATYGGISKEHVERGATAKGLCRSYYSSSNKETVKNLKSGVTYYFMIENDSPVLKGDGIIHTSEVVSVVVK